MSEKSDFEKLKKKYEKLVASHEELKLRMKTDLTVRVMFVTIFQCSLLDLSFN